MQVEDFILTNASKFRLMDNLRIDFEQSRISIPQHEQLLSEIESFEYEFDEETRKYKLGAAEGTHDDLVIALALANWGQRGTPAFLTQERSSSYMGGGARSSAPVRGSYMGRR